MLSYSQLPGHYKTLHHCHSYNPTIIATIDALCKSDGIQDLKITNLHGHLLFDSSMDPALLAGVDDVDDKDTSLAGVHNKDTSLAGVPVPNPTIMINADRKSDAKSDHNTIDPNEADDNSSKASVHSTRSHIPIHSATSEPPPQHPPYEEELDDIELPELDTQALILHHSKRVSVQPSDYIPWMGGKRYVTNVQTKTSQDKDKGLVYNHDKARVLARDITTFNVCIEHIVEEHEEQYVVTYSLKAGINKFGDQAKASGHKEMKQLHDRSCFRPVCKYSLNKSDRHRAMTSLHFLTEKGDKMVKSKHCANGSTQCIYMEHDEVLSPTVSTERTLLSAVIEAQEGKDITTCDIPNAFIQTHVDEKDKDGNQTIMKIRGVCVDMLCEIDPIYQDYMVTEGNQKVLYVHITQAIYRMVVSAKLIYCKQTKAWLSYSLELDPYDPCVLNKMVNGEQLTIFWHVADLKSSHIDPMIQFPPKMVEN